MRITAKLVVRIFLALGLLIVLAANLPGQLSLDSVMEVYEGQSGLYASNNPPFVTWVLGFFYHIIPGTGLFVSINAFIFFAALWILLECRQRVSWWAVPVALAIVFSPIVIITEGTVWKDVLFANLSLLAFAFLAFTTQKWPDPRLRVGSYLGCCVLLAFAALARQNGLICLLCAAAAVAAVTKRLGAKQWIVFSSTFFVAGIVVMQLTNIGVSFGHNGAGGRSTTAGVRLLRQYDIIGTVHFDPRADLGPLSDPDAAAGVRQIASTTYSPVRQEAMYVAGQKTKSLWAVPPEPIEQEWYRLVTHDTAAYLKHRTAAFEWVFLTPNIGLCIPAYVGISGIPQELESLRMREEIRPQDAALFNYATYFFHTPVYSHLTYAILSLILIWPLSLRRSASDIAILAMLCSGLLFAASFYFISLACDFRYLFFLDVAAMAGLLYVALDPPLRRKGADPVSR